jgi:hypothetical protein
MVAQIVFIVWITFSLGYNMSKHGEEKEGYHNAWIDFFTVLIIFGILFWGGFFKVFYE